MQAIANTAGFHFAYIEQGGSSLYSIMALKASSLEALRIIVSIGGVETNHFSLWHDKAGNAVAQPLAGVTDPATGVTFPDLNAKGGELNQTNLILPEPCEFLHPSLPACSIVRPTDDQFGGAVATIESFTADRLFEGQSARFFSTVKGWQGMPTPLCGRSPDGSPPNHAPPTNPRKLAGSALGSPPRRGRSGFPKGDNMLGDILQPTHLIFVLIVALLFLGPKRLPSAGRALARD